MAALQGRVSDDRAVHRLVGNKLSEKLGHVSWSIGADSRLTIGPELCLPPSQIPLYWRTGRCGRAFARRFHEPKFIKLPSVGCTCRSVEEREGSPLCLQPR